MMKTFFFLVFAIALACIAKAQSLGSAKINTNVGINTSDPQYTLDVAGSFRTTKTGIIGGALEVDGNAVLKGSLKIAGGNPGEGKVLTSDASGNANWKASSFSNPERFMVTTYNDFVHGTSNTVEYKTSTFININSSAGSVVINKTGLYHFEASFEDRTTFDVSQSSADPRLLSLYLTVGAHDYELSTKNPYSKNHLSNGSLFFDANAKGGIDIYITAGTILQKKLEGSLSYTFHGYLSGYLISE